MKPTGNRSKAMTNTLKTAAAALNTTTVTVIQFPSGTWGFVGSVPEALLYGPNACPEKLAAARHCGAAFGPKTITHATREGAVAAANAHGIAVA
jgi:hypothetical protein